MTLKQHSVQYRNRNTCAEAERSLHALTATEVEEEPPSRPASTIDSEDEPPLKRVLGKDRLFPDVPRELWNDWKWQFRNRITTIDQLARYILLTPAEQKELRLVTWRYPLSITPHYLSLIDPDDPNDPVRKQAVPCLEEISMGDIGREDPLEEERDSVVPGLVHRYPDRVLMVLTDICPMLCRHCTRKREWRNGGWVRPMEEVEAMLAYIRRHKAVRDVIVSGGDPLTLSNSHLDTILGRIRGIPHVEIIRIGTRFPVVLPQRIDGELCQMLSKHGPLWLNTHFNHAREITPESADACDRLLRHGIPVNNQTVLLRGVNDSVEEQLKLCHGLLRAKVRPYYLFQCDEVQGTEHLRTPIETGINIIKGMRGYTSGLAIPNFVVDLPEGGGKVPLGPNYVVSRTEDEIVMRNYRGHFFRCHNPKAAAAESLPIDDAINFEGEAARDAARVII